MEILAGIIAAFKAIPALSNIIDKIANTVSFFVDAWKMWHKEMNENEYIDKVKRRNAIVSEIDDYNRKLITETDTVKSLELRNARKKAFYNLYDARYN